MARRRSAVDADTDLGIEQVYAQIPDTNCKGLCHSWCAGAIPASAREHRRVTAVGSPLPLLDMGPCSNLQMDGQCAVYEVRPMICRLWGAVENMQCPHGCVPIGGHLTRAQGGVIVAEMVRVAGEAL